MQVSPQGKTTLPVSEAQENSESPPAKTQPDPGANQSRLNSSKSLARRLPIPTELVHQVASHLAHRDVYAFSATSKALYADLEYTRNNVRADQHAVLETHPRAAHASNLAYARDLLLKGILINGQRLDPTDISRLSGARIADMQRDPACLVMFPRGPLPQGLEPEQVEIVAEVWEEIREGRAVPNGSTMEPDGSMQINFFVSPPDYVNEVMARGVHMNEGETVHLYQVGVRVHGGQVLSMTVQPSFDEPFSVAYKAT